MNLVLVIVVVVVFVGKTSIHARETEMFLLRSRIKAIWNCFLLFLPRLIFVVNNLLHAFL